MNKMLLFIVIALTILLGGCNYESTPDESKRLGLICINGWVYQEHKNHNALTGKSSIRLENLDIRCPSGKIRVSN